jgi:D-alanine-D-alanine ligase
VLHGVDGEDGAVAGLLRMTGVPFVGSPVRAGALATDKWATKLVAEAVGVATAPGVLLPVDAEPEDVALVPPLVVKPTSAGSSDGVSRVDDLAGLPDAIARARAAGDRVLVESFVSGLEVDVALFRDSAGELRAGSTLEIGVPSDGLFDREAKYDGSAEFTLPARVTRVERAEVERAARLLYEVLGCSGVARFDFFVTPAGVVLNEVNTAPGFTERSQVPRMFAAVGLGYVDLVAALVDAALLPATSRPRPGPGRQAVAPSRPTW